MTIDEIIALAGGAKNHATAEDCFILNTPVELQFVSGGRRVLVDTVYGPKGMYPNKIRIKNGPVYDPKVFESIKELAKPSH